MTGLHARGVDSGFRRRAAGAIPCWIATATICLLLAASLLAPVAGNAALAAAALTPRAFLLTATGAGDDQVHRRPPAVPVPRPSLPGHGPSAERAVRHAAQPDAGPEFPRRLSLAHLLELIAAFFRRALAIA